ncbi:MAG TPA: hypothetical protein VFP84_16105 [Kofleriaceae bacterium]|nr:hypothetical protein [Kofleriaceae bacterium]
MNRYVLFVGASLSWLGSATLAAAAPPAWCGSAKFEATSEDVRMAQSRDPGQAVEEIAKALCSTSGEVAAKRGELEAARAAWSKKLGMQDGDWADAAAFAADAGRAGKQELSAKGLAALTPIDQYIAIDVGFKDGNGYAISDPLYLTDALESRLTEVGRLSWLRQCVKNDSVARADGDVVKWAICQADLDKFDAGKFASELRGDTAHDPATRMALRIKLFGFAEELEDYNKRKAALLKKDDAYQKIFEVAAKARAEWAHGVGGNAQLLALVESTDSGALFRSRKLLDGCEDKTAAALAAAVATLPAKAFTAMHDVRDDPSGGFAAAAGPLLVNTPVVNLAASAYVVCHKGSATADFLGEYLQRVPGERGPRNAALGAIMGETFKLDDPDAKKLEYLPFGTRPYQRSGGAIRSAGGVVKSTKPEGDALAVDLEKTSVVQEDCVASHHTHRISRIRPDGVLEYESICDKTALVKHDTTWANFKVNPADAKWLKPGTQFSSVMGGKLGDVIAIWPSKSAKTPSMVLGATLK